MRVRCLQYPWDDKQASVSRDEEPKGERNQARWRQARPHGALMEVVEQTLGWEAANARAKVAQKSVETASEPRLKLPLARSLPGCCSVTLSCSRLAQRDVATRTRFRCKSGPLTRPGKPNPAFGKRTMCSSAVGTSSTDRRISLSFSDEKGPEASLQADPDFCTTN